jgi:hypothetical protein
VQMTRAEAQQLDLQEGTQVFVAKQ